MTSFDQIKFYAFLLFLLASFGFSLVVYRQRKELGFLLMSIGLGVQSFMGLFGLLSQFGLSGVYQSFIKVAYPLNYLPLVCALAGWILLSRKKPGAS